MRITRHTTMLAAVGPAYRGPARRDDPGDGPAGGAGGDGGGGNTGGTGSGDGGKPANDGTGGTGDDGTKKPKFDGDYDPDRAARALASARDSEKKAKDEARAAKEQQQKTLDTIAVALGLKPDPNQDPTEAVKKAAEERDKAQAAARTQAVELAVYRTAGKAGGDPDALLDSRTFLRSLEDLDPTEAKFGDKVADAIKAAVKDNPKLAAATGTGDDGSDGKKNAGGTGSGGQGPARQGADHTGKGTGGKQRPNSLSAAIAAQYNN